MQFPMQSSHARKKGIGCDIRLLHGYCDKVSLQSPDKNMTLTFRLTLK